MTVKMRSTGLKYYRRDLKHGDEFDCDEKDLKVVKLLGAEEVRVTRKPDEKPKVEITTQEVSPKQIPNPKPNPSAPQATGKIRRQYNRRDMEAKV